MDGERGSPPLDGDWQGGNLGWKITVLLWMGTVAGLLWMGTVRLEKSGSPSLGGDCGGPSLGGDCVPKASK